MQNFVVNDKALDAYRYAREKVIVFVIPGIVRTGVQGVEIKFPFNGLIFDIYANNGTPGATDTIIGIQKCSEADYDSSPVWEDVLTNNIILESGEKSSKTSSTSYIINTEEVNTNDHFRLNIDTLGDGLRDLTVEIKVKLI
jgi:hypothetical protein